MQEIRAQQRGGDTPPPAPQAGDPDALGTFRGLCAKSNKSRRAAGRLRPGGAACANWALLGRPCAVGQVLTLGADR